MILDRMTFDTASKIKLTEDRVVHSKEYMHKDMQDGTEVCLLKHPLTVDEWNQILRNQEIVEKLPELIKSFLIETMHLTLDDTAEKTIKMAVKTWLGKED